MAIRDDQIAERLRAYRVGKGLSTDEVALRLGLSRAAIYRMEKGELIKIETLERVSDLLGVSLASLLDAGVEYHSNAVSFLERMRQIELTSERVLRMPVMMADETSTTASGLSARSPKRKIPRCGS